MPYAKNNQGLATGSPMPRPSTTSPQQGDRRLSGPPSGQGAGGGARIRNRGVTVDLRTDSLATEPLSHRRFPPPPPPFSAPGKNA
ncbi:hypothetical protein PoB_004038300 [Plakobranchus ocellatus]|uniref:Uncharacterized protein n=1 Tax=Plakobranchus ocellatus TaxID=259542 RepID=A0AAV4B446_9GAST|nr:hypothetical protein PoB_004038300 [Plakobranchus ocellatus]